MAVLFIIYNKHALSVAKHGTKPTYLLHEMGTSRVSGDSEIIT